MGLFNFLAVGNSLRGLVGRRFNFADEADSMIPNFGLKPEVADRLREVRESRRREHPFAGRYEPVDREIGQRLREHPGPRVRSTFRPEEPMPEGVESEPTQAVVHPESEATNAAPPAPNNGAGWVRKLKLARRVDRRPVENGKRVKRQPKRPSVYRGAAAARQRRAPQWMAGT